LRTDLGISQVFLGIPNFQFEEQLRARLHKILRYSYEVLRIGSEVLESCFVAWCTVHETFITVNWQYQ